METMSTIESVKRTPSGAYAITFLGGVVAGTHDESIGELAESLAGDNDANPVAVKMERHGGKIFVQKMVEITPPEELGGHEADGTGQAMPEPADRSPGAPPPSDPTGDDPGPDSMETMIHDGEEIVESDKVEECAAAITRAHVMVNDLADKLDVVGLRHIVIPEIQEKLGEAATALRAARQV